MLILHLEGETERTVVLELTVIMGMTLNSHSVIACQKFYSLD